MIGCQKQIHSFFFLPYTLLLSNTYKTYSKAAVRYLRLNTEMKLNTRKRIYYLRILSYKTFFFKIMVIETLVQVEQYSLRNRVAFISLHLLSR